MFFLRVTISCIDNKQLVKVIILSTQKITFVLKISAIRENKVGVVGLILMSYYCYIIVIQK